MKYALLVERPDLRGRVLFRDTGRTVESDDPHGAVMAAQEKDGRCYAVSAAPASFLIRLWRHFAALL